MRERPRLSARVQARRHVLDGAVHVVLHAGERTLAIGEREWTVLRMADGTRDLEGVRLAAGRAGARVRAEHVRAFFEELDRLGLLVEDEPAEAPAFAPNRPITPLPGVGFRCDGSGSCCTQFDTVLFTPRDLARARALLPEVGGAGDDPERAFVPSHGCDSPLRAVTRADGACLYFDRGCRIHEGKPIGCRTFPIRYIDTGVEIRASVRTECACVFASAAEGEPITAARSGAELPREVFVPAMTPARVGPDLLEPRALLALCDAIRARVEAGLDAAAWALALSERLARDGASASLDTIDARPSPEDIATWTARAERMGRTHLAWRGERDWLRLALDRVRAALARLTTDSPPVRHPEDEHLYLRAWLYAPTCERPLETELRERALILWIARAMDADPHPIATVEALTRAHALSPL